MSLECPLPNFKDFDGLFFLKKCLSEDVVDAADAQTLAEEGKFCLQVLAQLHTFMRSPDDVCLCQKLVRDMLARSHCNSERDTSASCGDKGERANIIDFPFRRSRIQVRDTMNDFCFLRISFCPNFSVSCRTPEDWAVPVLGDRECRRR